MLYKISYENDFVIFYGTIGELLPLSSIRTSITQCNILMYVYIHICFWGWFYSSLLSYLALTTDFDDKSFFNNMNFNCNVADSMYRTDKKDTTSSQCNILMYVYVHICFWGWFYSSLLSYLALILYFRKRKVMNFNCCGWFDVSHW